MRICFLLLVGLLTSLTVSAQTSPTPTVTSPTSVTAKPTTVAPGRVLTPAEQRQKEKQAEWLRKELEFRTMWAAKERARAEKEAQREREKAARRAEKEAQKQQKETEAEKSPKVAPTTQPAVVSTGAEARPKPAQVATNPLNDPDQHESEVQQAEAAKRAQADQREREKAAKQAERDRQTQADAAAKAQREQAERNRQAQANAAAKATRQAERDRQKQADAAAKATRQAERDRQKQADAAAKTQQDRVNKQLSQPEASPAPAAKPVAQPQVAPKPATVAKKPQVSPAQPMRTRSQKAQVRPDGPALASELQPDMLLGSLPVTEYFPKGHLFDPIVLDPIQSQASISVLPLFRYDGTQYQGTIVPFSFGFDKPIFRRFRDKNRTDELAIDAGSFTQFQVYHDETDGVNRRRLLNTDYRVSILYNLRRYDHVWRFRLYHLSSHIGDDYIFQNQLTVPTPNSVNYEVIDATYSRQINRWRVYGGLGFVLRRWSERKPITAEFGAYYKKPINPTMRMVGGFDAKFWQQTDFRPGIKAAWGIELGKPNNYITFLVEGYTGFRPYSQYENQTVTWLGISTYLNPF